jgi:urease accessory protein
MSTEPPGPTSQTAIRAARGEAGAPVRVEIRREGAPGAAGLRAVVLQTGADRARVALVADGALLLAGDRVAVSCAVEEGVRLDVVETGGTVAYDMRGGRAGWELELDVAGVLTWVARPFVAATGADVERRSTLRLRGAGRALVREIAVLGRSGECGGRITSRTHAWDDEGDLLVEELTLSPENRRPGILGHARVLDTVTAFGYQVPEARADSVLALDRRGWIIRELLTAFHESTIEELFHGLAASEPDPDHWVRAICSWTENSKPSAAAR